MHFVCGFRFLSQNTVSKAVALLKGEFSPSTCFERLAAFVREALGIPGLDGIKKKSPGLSDDQVEARFALAAETSILAAESFVLSEKTRRGCNVLPIGLLIEENKGVCRHASLLFKYLADRCNHLSFRPRESRLHVAVVFGDQFDENGEEAKKPLAHAWNVVQMDSGASISRLCSQLIFV
jgi:hypothetical protein